MRLIPKSCGCKKVGLRIELNTLSNDMHIFFQQKQNDSFSHHHAARCAIYKYTKMCFRPTYVTPRTPLKEIALSKLPSWIKNEEEGNEGVKTSPKYISGYIALSFAGFQMPDIGTQLTARF